VFALYTTLPGLQLSAIEMQPRADRQTYSLLHLNLLWNHDNPAPVMDWLVEQDADLLSLAEASSNWAPHLGKLERRYPYFFECTETGKRGGVKLYSKWPFDDNGYFCAEYGVFGTARATTPEGDELVVGSLHLRWPWPASGPRQMDAILPEVAQLGPDALIIGDFNATTWSHALARFSRTGDLTIVPGIGPTWLFEEIPAWIAEWVGFPIDNAAHKGRVRVLQADRLKNVGSDHFPIRVIFQIQ
jgi:endonuclease/exonuclease/phosphatase (EEP) superfamily protein YafD